VYRLLFGLVAFSVFSNVLLSVFPSGKYSRYARLFSGTAFILIMVGAMLDFTGKEGMAGGWLEECLNSIYLEDVRLDMTLAGEEALGTVVEPFLEAIREDIRDKAWEYALVVNYCNPVIITDMSSSELGSLDSIELSVSRAADGDIAGEAGEDGGIARVEIGKIIVGDDGNNMDVADGDVTKLKEYIARNYEIGEEKVIIK
jgi:stage III sporulation protein AF